MTISEYIIEMRKQKNLSQRRLAIAADINNATISRIEKGEVSPDAETLTKLAKALGISAAELFQISGYLPEPKEIPEKKGVLIPVLGMVPAGIPLEAVENIIDYEEISAEMARGGEFFGLKIIGDSMESRIKEGDVVIVRKQDDVDSGKIAVVMLNDNCATIKKLVKHTDGISLMPFNPAYPPAFYTWKEVENIPISVIGQVVELRGKL